MKRCTLLVWLFCALVGGSICAAPVTPAQVKAAVGTWLSCADAPLGARFKSRSADNAEIVGMKDSRGRTLYYVASLKEGGFVVTSSDTDLTPIVAFSGSGSMEKFEGSPLQALLNGDQGEKLDALATKGRSPANAVLRSTAGKARGAAQGPAAQWAKLIAGETPGGRGVESVSDVRVAKLLETEWDQAEWGYSGDPTFNYYTPNGYVCGCVATAGAQIMRYWRQPTGSIASFSNPECSIDGYYSTQSSIYGTFDWDNMPTSYRVKSTLSETERRAIGKLTYNVGVAVGMDWGMYGSGAATANIVSSLKDRFNYRSGTFVYYMLYAGSVVSADAQNALYASLDAGMPVPLSIGGDGGHSIVADGYGYSSNTRYTHLNMGWSGSYDVWYNLMGESIQAGYSFTVLKGMGFNIHPSESGDIISGRVLSSAGSPVSGATVTLYGSSGSTLGTAMSNAKGIYYFRVTSSGTYRVSAASGSQTSSEATVVISSMSSSSGSGNRWGNDLTLGAGGGGGSVDRPDLGFDRPANEGWPASVFLTSDMYGRSAQTSFEDGDTLYIHAGFGNQSSSVPLTGAFKVRHEVLRGGSVVASYDYEIDDELTWGTVLYWDGFSWDGLQNLSPGSYTYRCTLDATENIAEENEDNNTWTYEFTVTGGSGVSLNTALDTASLSFTTGGSADWFGQTAEYYVGGSAARSGGIAHGQTSWMQTTVNGAGTLSFWWKTSSESGYDKLHLYVDGAEVTEISGSTSWQPCSVEFESGSHTVRWSYEKDVSVNRDEDCGWVDYVAWDASDPNVATVTFDPQGGVVQPTAIDYTPGGEHSPFPTPHRSGYLFEGWYTEPNGAGSYVNVASIVPSANRTLYANWVRSSITLDEALSDGGLSFSTGGDSGWEQTVRFTYDGVASAQSGACGAYGSSWVETVIEGPGILSFRWATSSETNYDKLKLVVDGQEIEAISGATSMEYVECSLGSGAHTVRWVYAKDGSVDRGWDCGYLDDVWWEPFVSDEEVVVSFDGNGGTASETSLVYTYRADADPMYIYGYMPTATHSNPSYAFDGWYTSASGGSQVTADTEVDPSITHLYAHWRVIQTIPVGTAVNAPALSFSFGDVPWFGQSDDSYDGDGAAQSGAIADGQSSWMETRVEGAGTLSFWWKTSSESGYDKLRISIDGAVVEEFSGINGWTRFTYDVSGGGTHEIRWTYQKDWSVSVGEDCARVDAIQFGERPVISSDPRRHALCVGINEYFENYIPSYNWLNCCVSDATSVRSLLTSERCGWPEDQAQSLFNTAATKSAVVNKFNELARTVRAGDQVVYFHSSHGGQNYGTSTFICMADQGFEDTDFAQAISVFPAGVKLLIVIDACHSGGMFKAFGGTGPDFDMAAFVNRVTERLNEIRFLEFAAGKRDMPRIAASDIAWITAADYDQYSWENQNGGFFTTEFVNCIRTGAADLNTGYGVGDGDGQVNAWEAGSYVKNRWDGVLIGGQYYMTPQLGNDDALRAFEFYYLQTPTPEDRKPNLRWCVAQGWPQEMFLTDTYGGVTPVSSFRGGDSVYMCGAFQNGGESATPGPFVIRHELLAADGVTVLTSWDDSYSSILAADPSTCVGWSGAYWSSLNGLGSGDYVYRCTLDPNGAMSETDETDNVVTFRFSVLSQPTVTVWFEGNGGTASQASRTYDVGSCYSPLPSATRDGYSFLGWFTEAQGGSQVTETDTVRADVTRLYAQWQQATYPDLTVRGLSASKESVGSMESFSLGFTVRNDGGLKAQGSTAAVYADFDGAGFVRLGEVAVSGLGAGSSQTLSYRVAGGQFASSAVFRVRADDRNEVAEDNESNNESEPCAVGIGNLVPPGWVSASVTHDPQAMPTIFDGLHITIDGANVPAGSHVGIFRTDTGVLCGRSEVYANNGLVTTFVSVTSGTRLHFKVWTPDHGELDSSVSDDEIVVGAGTIISGKELAIRSNLSNFDLTLSFAEAGWHLASVNVLPDDPSPASVFADANDGIDYVVGSENQLWNPYLPTSSLRVMEIGKGYWVHTSRPDVSCTVSGTPCTGVEIRLAPGWNMVGYTLVQPASAAEALATALSENKIRYVCTPGNSNLFPYNPLTMRPGEGYWVFAENACTLFYDAADSAVLARAPASRDVAHPWAGMSPVCDNVMPTIFENVFVKANGQVAVKGDVIATFDAGTGDFLGAAEIIDNGLVSWAVAASGSRTLCFKLWHAGVTTDGLPAQNVSADPGGFYRGLTLEFGSATPPQPGYVTVTFDANGGTVVERTRTLPAGSQLGTPPVPEREGYRFSGWYDQSVGGTPVSEWTEISESVTYYAHWELNSYSVIFYPNYPAGVSGTGQMEDQLLTVGVRQELAPNGFRAQGWTFIGWATYPGGEAEYGNREPVDFGRTAGTTVRLYAVWREGLSDLYPNEGDGWYEKGVYDGWLYDPSERALVGTVKFTLGTFASQKITAKVALRDGRSYTYEGGSFSQSDGYPLRCSQRPGSRMAVRVGVNGISGTMDDTTLVVCGRNIVASGGKGYGNEAANELLDVYRRSWSVSLEGESFENYSRLQLDVQAKGVVKIAGVLADGTKISGKTSQLITDADGLGYVPVVLPLYKNAGSLSFLVRLIDEESAELISAARWVFADGLSGEDMSAVVVGASMAPEIEWIDERVEGFVGVSFYYPISINELGYPAKFSARGLPPGLKIDAATGEIRGVPSKAFEGKCTVTVESSAKLGKSEPETFEIVIRALPKGVVGNFDGTVSYYSDAGDFSSEGTAQVTVSDKGKISGKFTAPGLKMSLTGASYDYGYVEDDGSCWFVARLTGKIGGKTLTFEFVVDALGKVQGQEDENKFLFPSTACIYPVEEDSDDGYDLFADMHRNVWKDLGANRALGKYIGAYTAQILEGNIAGYETLKMDAKGNLKVAGKLPNGMSLSGSVPVQYRLEPVYAEATLVGTKKTLCFSHTIVPQGCKFGTTVGEMALFYDDVARIPRISRLDSTEPDSVATLYFDDPEGKYDGTPDSAYAFDYRGAYYASDLNMSADYAFRRIESELYGSMNSEPTFSDKFKSTDYTEYGGKETIAEYVENEGVPLSCWDVEDLFVGIDYSGKGYVSAKATKPGSYREDNVTYYVYEGINDAALTFSFTKSTGVFKGSFTCWYDYLSEEDYTTGKSVYKHVSKKVDFEGVLMQGDANEPLRGFYLWDRNGEYEGDDGKMKSYKTKERYPVCFEVLH